MRTAVTGAQRSESTGVATQRRILEQEVVREAVDGALGAELVVDRERREERLLGSSPPL